MISLLLINIYCDSTKTVVIYTLGFTYSFTFSVHAGTMDSLKVSKIEKDSDGNIIFWSIFYQSLESNRAFKTYMNLSLIEIYFVIIEFYWFLEFICMIVIKMTVPWKIIVSDIIMFKEMNRHSFRPPLLTNAHVLVLELRVWVVVRRMTFYAFNYV